MAPLIQWPKSRFGSGPASRELVVEVGKETEKGTMLILRRDSSVAVPVNVNDMVLGPSASQISTEMTPARDPNQIFSSEMHACVSE